MGRTKIGRGANVFSASERAARCRPAFPAPVRDGWAYDDELRFAGRLARLLVRALRRVKRV
jgi:hypothetical protein